MRTRALALASASAMLIAVPATADPQSTPNGPWVQPEQERQMAGLHDYEELVDALHRIEHSSQGLVDLEVVGQSVEERDLYLASVGSGDREVMYITQQHGNEVHGTEAALDLLRFLSGNSQQAREIREGVTLRIMPRVNPDGAELFQRPNIDGFDLNRQHDPDVQPEDNATPEAAAVREVHDEHQPDLFVDYHNQHTYVEEGGDMVTMSLFVSDHPDIAADADTKSRQMAVQAFDAVDRYGHATVTEFPGASTRTIADTAYALLGSGSLLVESRGQASQIGQKSAGMLIRQNLVVMREIAAAAADGSLDELDPARMDELPERGDFITNPR